MPLKDNSTLARKTALRTNLLAALPDPIVLETHAGNGRLYYRCYAHLPRGVAIEKNPAKVEVLARQRPGWAVYEADAVTAVRGGAGAHLPINLIDVDPYGEPWPVLDAFFRSDRPWPLLLGVVVNDGLRRHLKLKGGWQTRSMTGMVARYGSSSIYGRYLDVCRELLAQHAAQRGYALARWAGYYCGHTDQMTHYAALFRRDQAVGTGATPA